MENMFTLEGKTALVTGGGTGLGKSFAKTLLAAGATVIITGRRKTVLDEAVDELTSVKRSELNEQGGTVIAKTLDITDSSAIENAFRELDELGPIDILINNAGVIAKPMLLDVEEEEWDSVFDTNLKGVWLMSREFSHRLIQKQLPGSIINIASILGTAVQKGTGPYSASKAALLQLTRNMAVEWSRHHIRVNAIAPGYFMTDLAEDYLHSENGKKLVKAVPQRRLGEVEDLAGSVLLLASDASRYMTGSVITVDGGLGLPKI